MELNVNMHIELGRESLELLKKMLEGRELNGANEINKVIKDIKVQENSDTKEKKGAFQGEGVFAQLADQAKLNIIKKEINTLTKLKKNREIKELLLEHGAIRASELAPETYDMIYEALTNLKK